MNTEYAKISFKINLLFQLYTFKKTEIFELL